MSEVNRRDFMKTAGAAGAFMIAQGINVKSYAQNDKVQVACIGTGGQGTFHIRTGLAGNEGIQIVGVADVFFPHQKSGCLYGQISNAKVIMEEGQRFSDLDPDTQAKVKAAPRPQGFYDYKEMLATLGDQVDAVVISTPLDSHYQISMDCLDAGKWVFCEKTLVQTIEQGRALVQKCHETGKFVQVGHQRRYNPKYNLAMDIVYNQGYLGRITHITAQWHRNNNWRRNWEQEYPDYQMNDEEKKYIADLEKHLNWRMYASTSGGLFTELATHQTDVANWFLQAAPTRVHTFAGLDYWRDGREVEDNIVLAYEYSIKPGDPGFVTVDTRSQLQDPAKVNKSYTVRFVYTSILQNQKRGASELIQGDNGTLELSETVCKFYAEPVWNEAPPKKKEEADPNAPKEEGDDASSIVTGGTLLTPEQMKALAEGKELLGTCDIKPADIYQFEAFAHHIKNGGVPRTNQMVGLTTAIGAIAAIQSLKEKRTVDIDPAWYTFDFEVPGFSDFAYDKSQFACAEEAAPAEAKPADAPAADPAPAA